MSDCIFCKIATGAIAAEKIMTHDQFFVIKDLHPKAPIHLLVIAHEHISSLLTVEAGHQALLGKMLLATNNLAKQYNLTGFRTIINAGKSGGQEIFHLHVHFLANSNPDQKQLPGF